MHAITLGSAQISTSAGEAVGLDFSSVTLDQVGWFKVLAGTLLTALETLAQERPDVAQKTLDAASHVITAAKLAVEAATPPAPPAEEEPAAPATET